MNSSRLRPLRDAAQQKEDGAVRRFAEKQGALASQESRLAELRGYLAEYAKPATAQLGTLLRMRRDFVERLREVVRAQEAAVEQARQACALERARWLLAHRSTEVLDKLAERYRTAEVRADDRRAQRESDELATRLWRASRPGS